MKFWKSCYKMRYYESYKYTMKYYECLKFLDLWKYKKYKILQKKKLIILFYSYYLYIYIYIYIL